MTSQTVEKPVARRPETGWSRTRRLHGKGDLRTCLPAIEDRGATVTVSTGEGNIFRGED
ncbi:MULTISPECIES: hypothetical protein [Streptomyces]|uniref:hypothetical protein n=1 Tax=Streptomyces TaxID=1883 RepID=UPI002E259094|nr:hypothetical protein OH837_05030 [Streptomyces canus]WSZ35955.1 hypothetical protein OG806_44345 [Streptomyces sp. NBC_00882]WSZ62886.1 hypothetical protein OH824_43220 [Streptomyces canus]